MKKQELEKIWKQLDGACDALEKLQETLMDLHGIDVTAIVGLKNDVEALIVQKSRTKLVNLK